MGVGKDVHEGREYDGEEWAELPEFVGVLYPESPCIGLKKVFLLSERITVKSHWYFAP